VPGVSFELSRTFQFQWEKPIQSSWTGSNIAMRGGFIASKINQHAATWQQFDAQTAEWRSK
jgi:hypothetical protein